MTQRPPDTAGTGERGGNYRALPLAPAPAASSAAVRAVLVANRRRDTAPELALRRELFRLGLRFLVDVSPEGISKRRRVDVLLRGSRLAVLVHGCFWHCCTEHFVMPRSNAAWWQAKFASIAHRDADTIAQLVEAGWHPVIVWEHEKSKHAAARIAALHELRIRHRQEKGFPPCP